MLPVADDDVHFAGETDEFAGPRIGDNGDAQLRNSACHGSGVLEDEGTVVPVQSSRHLLDSNVACGAFDGGPGGKHLPLAGAFKTAMELLGDRHPAQVCILAAFTRRLRRELHFKCTGRVVSHRCSFQV